MRSYSYDSIQQFYNDFGYPFETAAYKVNNWGFRNKDLQTVNVFNDLRGVAYVDDFGQKICLQWKATTKPGLTYLKDKVGNPNGTAILIPGFYKDCWMIGKHNRGKEHEHDALVQSGAGVFKVWRDNNSDGKFDFSGKEYDDVTGLNDHTTRAHQINNVGSFSAACMVTQDDKEHMVKMAICMRSFELYGGKFSYALFQEK